MELEIIMLNQISQSPPKRGHNLSTMWKLAVKEEFPKKVEWGLLGGRGDRRGGAKGKTEGD